jgi:formylglycine-generating enzyme
VNTDVADNSTAADVGSTNQRWAYGFAALVRVSWTAPDGSGELNHGSGFLVTRDLVVTAKHVVQKDGRAASPKELLCRHEPSNAMVGCKRIERHDVLDLALLWLDEPLPCIAGDWLVESGDVLTLPRNASLRAFGYPKDRGGYASDTVAQIIEQLQTRSDAAGRSTGGKWPLGFPEGYSGGPVFLEDGSHHLFTGISTDGGLRAGTQVLLAADDIKSFLLRWEPTTELKCVRAEAFVGVPESRRTVRLVSAMVVCAVVTLITFAVYRNIITRTDAGITAKGVPSARETSFRPALILVSSNMMLMGTPAGESFKEEGETEHKVFVTLPFLMSQTEITQLQFKSLMGYNPLLNRKTVLGNDCEACGVADDLPVFCVTWFEAIAYCNKLSQSENLAPAYTTNSGTIVWAKDSPGYRLPTEAEWELAVRGVRCNEGKLTYANGNLITILGESAWYKDNSGNKPHFVGTKTPNSLGLFDMNGNVWEWVWDWYEPFITATATNPAGPENGSFKVWRGGSWYTESSRTRIGLRWRNPPETRAADLGFRVVRYAQIREHQ